MISLSERIACQIAQDGPICFHDFMEMCLYDPESGYYSSNCNGIGSAGDFYTCATLSPVFGALIGKQLEEMWAELDYQPFTIVEFGAGTGHLCRDILSYLKGNEKMYTALRYCIIEKSPRMRSYASKRLPPDVEWYDCIAQIGEINGCVLSNELIDNFAVHRVVMQKELMEVYVDYQDGFAESLKPASLALRSYLLDLNVELPLGYATEINLEATEWITEVGLAMSRGYILTIDYGHKSPAMYNSGRSQGTLLCYYRHSLNDCFYDHIGEQDITSHVNFSALSHWGSLNGLTEIGFIDQGAFLLGLGFHQRLLQEISNEPDVISAAQKAARISHILIRDMGSKLKVLIQTKGENKGQLSGFSTI